MRKWKQGVFVFFVTVFMVVFANQAFAAELPDPHQNSGWDGSSWVQKQVSDTVYNINKGIYSFTETNSPKNLMDANTPGRTNVKWMGVFDSNQESQIKTMSNFFYALSWSLVVVILMTHGIKRASIGSFNPNVRLSENAFFGDLAVGTLYLLFGETFMDWVLRICGDLAKTLIDLGGSIADMGVTMDGYPLMQEIIQFIVLILMIVLWFIYKLRAVLLAIFISFWPLIGVSQMHDKTKGVVHFWWKEFGVCALLPIIHGFLLALFGVFNGKAAGTGKISPLLNNDLHQILNFLYGLGTVAVLAGLIWSSVQMSSSLGNSDKREKAWKGYKATASGAVFVFGAFIIQAVMGNVVQDGYTLYGALGIQDFNTLIKNVMLAFYVLGGTITLCSTVFVGVKFANSGGRSEKRQQAWVGLVGVIIGSMTLYGSAVATSILKHYILSGN